METDEVKEMAMGLGGREVPSCEFPARNGYIDLRRTQPTHLHWRSPQWQSMAFLRGFLNGLLNSVSS
jgi:hypothetical protein